jgi:hypothetical protein
LKSKATRNKVPAEFCTELANLLEYWNENKLTFREQDRLLTNIYEDLSGAVRVYVRIKPLIGSEQKSKTIGIQVIENKKQKNISLDCGKDARNTYGEFYGIFDETYSNLDVYTGIENSSTQSNDILKVDIDNIIESSESISPGLYNTFKQVEDGYSIVIFGYGLSGSGKTFTLLGSNGSPGLIHYGLGNLRNVSNIKLKYLFEQYFSAVDVNFNKVRGRLHSLVREVPQMRKFSKDESKEFAKRLPSNMNLDNIKVEDVYLLTDIIEKYRIEQGRIKKTPNNPVSSRSHLFFVFEITFDTGKTGYVTLVDTAGRESPIDIFNTFIDTKKTQLASIMAPSGGEALIDKTKLQDLDQEYTSNHILNVLREGFFINETINHLIYYFNKKNFKSTKIILQPNDPSKYTVSKYYVKPYEEEKTINETNNCLTIPLMNFLDNLSNKGKTSVEWKPTKFIMMCMVRQEERYCNQIIETLEFASNVKSS